MSAQTQDEVMLRDVKVTRVCRVCSHAPSWYGVLSTKDPYLVSATGVVHWGEDGGRTYCGCDATGLGWWWKL